MKRIWASVFIVIASAAIAWLLLVNSITIYRDCQAYAAEVAGSGMKVHCDIGWMEPLCIVLALGILSVELVSCLRAWSRRRRGV